VCGLVRYVVVCVYVRVCVCVRVCIVCALAACVLVLRVPYVFRCPLYDIMIVLYVCV